MMSPFNPPTTALTAGPLRLTFPTSARVPSLNLRPGANTVDVTVTNFTGTLTFELIPQSVCSSPMLSPPEPLTQPPCHSSPPPSQHVDHQQSKPLHDASSQQPTFTCASQDSAVVSAATSVPTPTSSQPVATTSQALSVSMPTSMTMPLSSSQPSFDLAPVSDFHGSGAGVLNSSSAASQPISMHMLKPLSDPLASSDFPPSSSGTRPNSDVAATLFDPLPLSRPASNIVPTGSGHTSALPESQFPDSIPGSQTDGDSQTLVPCTPPPMPHFPGASMIDVPESPPLSDDEEEAAAPETEEVSGDMRSEENTEQHGANRKSQRKYPSLLRSINESNRMKSKADRIVHHLSALARVESRPHKHGKRVRFDENPIIVGSPPLKKPALAPAEPDPFTPPRTAKGRTAVASSPSPNKSTEVLPKPGPDSPVTPDNPRTLPSLHSSPVPLQKVSKILPVETNSVPRTCEKNWELEHKKADVGDPNSPSSPPGKAVAEPDTVAESVSHANPEPNRSQTPSQPLVPTPTCSPGQGCPWVSVETAPEGRPEARWGATLTALDGDNLLLVGGESNSDKFFRDATIYNVSEQVWIHDESRPPAMPSARAWHSSTRLDDVLFVFGGETTDSDNDDRQQTNSALVYDRTYRTWYTPSISGSAPTPRAGHCGALIPNTRNIAVFGGINGNKWMNDLFILHDLCEWKKVRLSSIKSARPSPRSYASLTPAAGYLVLFGGNNKSKCFNDVYFYVNETSLWVEPVVLGRSPKPRTGHCAVASKDGKSVIVYGGWDDQGKERIFYSDVWALRIESQTECHWSCIYAGNNAGSTPGPRAGAAMCSGIGKDDGELLLFGGWHQIKCFNDLTRLEIAANGRVRACSTR